ncbi:hypothetical protein NMY22_g1400 [Coprinellus aureogranulatus]|nr:hypothetical protein NMY22_g1400 [Coprinellus aureogranulatus]
MRDPSIDRDCSYCSADRSPSSSARTPRTSSTPPTHYTQGIRIGTLVFGYRPMGRSLAVGGAAVRAWSFGESGVSTNLSMLGWNSWCSRYTRCLVSSPWDHHFTFRCDTPLAYRRAMRLYLSGALSRVIDLFVKFKVLSAMGGSECNPPCLYFSDSQSDTLLNSRSSSYVPCRRDPSTVFKPCFFRHHLVTNPCPSVSYAATSRWLITSRCGISFDMIAQERLIASQMGGSDGPQYGSCRSSISSLCPLVSLCFVSQALLHIAHSE